jgi:Tfp pilus assembly protein PilP
MSGKLLFAMAAIALVSACGDDGGAAGPATPAAAAAAAAAAGSANALIPRVHIEDRVPDQEKASIRHTFKERDFAADTNRDPFQSFFISLPGTPNASSEPTGIQPGSVCTRPDQLVATSYSYADLKLVGIIAQGTQRKVLMIDSAQYGHSIKRGDCVGKEKALVKDIGTGFITFVVMPDQVPNGSQRPPEEHSVQLHPTDLPLGEYQPPREEVRQTAPVMPPTSPTGPQRPTLQMPAPVPTPAGVPLSPSAPPPVVDPPPVKT